MSDEYLPFPDDKGLRWWNIGPYPDHLLRVAKDGRGGLHIMHYDDMFGVTTNLHLRGDELRALLPYVALVCGHKDFAERVHQGFRGGDSS